MNLANLELSIKLRAAAEALAQRHRDGYTKDYEYELVDALMAELSPEQDEEVLAGFLFDHLFDHHTLFVCGLDYAEPGSYDALSACVDVLVAEIRVQGELLFALRERLAIKIATDAEAITRDEWAKPPF